MSDKPVSIEGDPSGRHPVFDDSGTFCADVRVELCALSGKFTCAFPA